MGVTDPLDTYCQQSITQILENHFGSINEGYLVYWSSDYSADKLVSMQRVASCSGLYYLDTTTHLTVHPKFGAWHSFRAVVIVRLEQPQPSEEVPVKSLPCLLSVEEEQEARKEFQKALQISDETKLCEQLHGNGPAEDVARAWIAVRDVVILGKDEHRFYDDQLMYHYTKNSKYLND